MIFLLRLMFAYIDANLRCFIKDKRAVTAIEYAILAVAISTLLFLVLGSGDDGLVSKIKGSFKAIQDALTFTKEESGK